MKCINADVIEVKVLNDYKLHILFDDGLAGDVDIAKLVPFKGVFEPLNDKKFFSRVKINSDIGTICWDNGADISPSLLHQSIQIKNFKQN